MWRLPPFFCRFRRPCRVSWWRALFTRTTAAISACSRCTWHTRHQTPVVGAHGTPDTRHQHTCITVVGAHGTPDTRHQTPAYVHHCMATSQLCPQNLVCFMLAFAPFFLVSLFFFNSIKIQAPFWDMQRTARHMTVWPWLCVCVREGVGCMPG